MAHIAPPDWKPNARFNNRDTLRPGEALRPDESLYSQNGRFNVTLQRNGKVAIYDNHAVSVDPVFEALVKEITTGSLAPDCPAALVFQDDGNLVGYTKDGTPGFVTSTSNNSGESILQMQNDGNLVMYDQNRTATWASNTMQSSERQKHVIMTRESDKSTGMTRKRSD